MKSFSPKSGRTRAEYEAAFNAERIRVYPVIEAFEQRHGYRLDRDRLEQAARVLACPIKNDKQGRERQVALWQHGRVLYSLARRFCHERLQYLTMLDIGTAKGFSALCLLWALDDAGAEGQVHSVDVLDPRAAVARHTIVEVDGLKTLAEILAPWPEAQRIQFHQSPSIEWLQVYRGRLPFVYVDGKHDVATVRQEIALIRERQQMGDVTVFDDVQIPAVAQEVGKLKGYEVEYLRPLPTRAYAIARRQ